MARNLFLDGNTFRHSHEVDRKPLVADLNLGLAFAWKKARLTFSRVFRSREFDGQNGADDYGSITLTYFL